MWDKLTQFNSSRQCWRQVHSIECWGWGVVKDASVGVRKPVFSSWVWHASYGWLWASYQECSTHPPCPGVLFLGIQPTEDFQSWNLDLCFVESLLAQMVSNLPPMQETMVWSLGLEAPLEKGVALTPGFWPGESHGQRSLAGYSPWGRRESDTAEWLQLSLWLNLQVWRVCVFTLLLLFSWSAVSDSFVTPWTVACQAPLCMGFPR